MALSRDIREKVVKAIAGGMSRRQAAARFDIGPATAVRWAKRFETTGEVAPLKRFCCVNFIRARSGCPSEAFQAANE
jgi:transposase